MPPSPPSLPLSPEQERVHRRGTASSHVAHAFLLHGWRWPSHRRDVGEGLRVSQIKALWFVLQVTNLSTYLYTSLSLSRVFFCCLCWHIFACQRLEGILQIGSGAQGGCEEEGWTSHRETQQKDQAQGHYCVESIRYTLITSTCRRLRWGGVGWGQGGIHPLDAILIPPPLEFKWTYQQIGLCPPSPLSPHV